MTQDTLPGQPTIRARVGDWASFRARMVAQLPLQTVPSGVRPLSALTTRDPSDATIGLIDAVACGLDVLTFYAERHLNEQYLATAQERLSLTLIARSIGYEPAPGVAAAGYLAFTTSPLSSGAVTVPAGTAVMAMPEGNELPATFETVESIEAHPAWNAIRPSQRQPVPLLDRTTASLWVDGIETRAQPGDGVLIYGADRLAEPGSERWEFRRLESVVDDAVRHQTQLVFDRPLGDPVTPPPAVATAVLIFRNRAALFGYNAPDWGAQSDQTQLTAWGRANRSFAGLPAREDLEDDRTRLMRRSPPVTEWPGFSLDEDPAVASGHIDLDREYPGIVAGSWVVLSDAYRVEAFEVLRASPRARVGFGLTGRVTRLRLRGENLALFDRRATVVHCEPARFAHVGAPDLSAVAGAAIRVRGDATALRDRVLSFFGPTADNPRPSGEIVSVTAATLTATGETDLTVNPPLIQAFRRDELVINANLARATHGETAAEEVLGSGNAAQPFQRFVLKGRPLTHVAAADAPGGRAAALEVRVGNVAWTEVPHLWGQRPEARVYCLRHAADGTTLVSFGDGVHGARLPTGVENVVARYRTGNGLAGEVDAGRATLLTRRPDDIDTANNPAPFLGGADPEAAESIRVNAPRTVLTLDRLVSLEDYGDFARAFPGIGKVAAHALTEGQRRLVHLTVASASGAPIPPTAPTAVALLGAIAARQDPIHHVTLATFQPRTFGLHAKLLIDAAYRWADVAADVRSALAAAFAFRNRGFGQGVTPAEVITVIQGVAGVRAVDLDRLWRTDQSAIAAPPLVVLAASPPITRNGVRQTAEMLLLSSDPAAVYLEPMQP